MINDSWYLNYDYESWIMNLELWFIIHNSWLMIHDSWFMILDSWFLTHDDSWLMIHDSWLMIHDSWLITHDSWLIHSVVSTAFFYSRRKEIVGSYTCFAKAAGKKDPTWKKVFWLEILLYWFFPIRAYRRFWSLWRLGRVVGGSAVEERGERPERGRYRRQDSCS